MTRSEFDDWVGGADDDEIEQMIQKATKKYHLFLLLSLIPGLHLFTTGLAVFCYNNLALLKSRGRSTGVGLIRWVLVIWGLIIIPFITIQACAKIGALGSKVLGI